VRLGGRLRCEVLDLVDDARDAWRRGARPILAVVACSLTVGAAVLSRVPRIRVDLLHYGGAYADQPLGHEMIRLPVAVFLPTSDLPLWGAVLQVFVVVALGEMLLGRLGTVTVALVGQLLSTVAARAMIAIGTGLFIGLPLSQARILDTGPSGVTVAVGAWLLSRRMAWLSVAVLGVVLTGFAFGQHNLDGVEHAAAYFVGVTLAALSAWASNLVKALAEVRAAVRRMSPMRFRRVGCRPGQAFLSRPMDRSYAPWHGRTGRR